METLSPTPGCAALLQEGVARGSCWRECLGRVPTGMYTTGSSTSQRHHIRRYYSTTSYKKHDVEQAMRLDTEPIHPACLGRDAVQRRSLSFATSPGTVSFMSSERFSLPVKISYLTELLLKFDILKTELLVIIDIILNRALGRVFYQTR